MKCCPKIAAPKWFVKATKTVVFGFTKEKTVALTASVWDAIVHDSARSFLKYVTMYWVLMKTNAVMVPVATLTFATNWSIQVCKKFYMHRRWSQKKQCFNSGTEQEFSPLSCHTKQLDEFAKKIFLISNTAEVAITMHDGSADKFDDFHQLVVQLCLLCWYSLPLPSFDILSHSLLLRFFAHVVNLL